MSAGVRFWQALKAEKPLQVVGTINAYSALLAEKAGFRAIYLSGAGVANASFGLPVGRGRCQCIFRPARSRDDDAQ
jgi:methylisocitrate lyase